MENEIYRVSFVEAELIKKEYLEKKNIYIAELDGRGINSWQDYIIEIQEIFQFPTQETNMDAYNDWMRDLDWLDKGGYVLFIYNFTDFLKNDSKLKKHVLNRFIDTILPWWQNDVELYVVDGKAKPFNVYLVD